MFKPAGIPARFLEEVVVTLDEFESVRLADFQGMQQAEAAQRMGVSRPTFGRIVNSARRKIADALVNGKALRIEGGPVLSDADLLVKLGSSRSAEGTSVPTKRGRGVNKSR